MVNFAWVKKEKKTDNRANPLMDILNKSSDETFNENRFRFRECVRIVGFLHKVQTCSLCSCVTQISKLKRKKNR